MELVGTASYESSERGGTIFPKSTKYILRACREASSRNVLDCASAALEKYCGFWEGRENCFAVTKLKTKKGRSPNDGR